jgi:5-formyltetrahydrofolate cyclo-ligase
LSTALRNRLRKQRQSLSLKEREEKSTAIARNLSRYLPFQRAKSVAFYMPTPEEVDACIAMEMAQMMSKAIFLPVINRSTFRQGALLFHSYTAGETRLISNRYGIEEPEHLAGNCVRGDELDLVCMPLVGFNRYGDRIGMGAGFYDRSFARTRYRRTHLVGLAYCCQEAEFEPAPHDVPMQAVITEEGNIRATLRGRREGRSGAG